MKHDEATILKPPPFPVRPLQTDEPIRLYRQEVSPDEITLDTEPIELSLWQKARLVPYIIHITWGVLMKNPKTTITGIIGGVAYLVNSIFAIAIPSEAIITVTLFLLGLFARDGEA
jgi:hypothetical protein